MYTKSYTSARITGEVIEGHTFNLHMTNVRVFPEADRKVTEANRRLFAERLLAAKSRSNLAFMQRYGFESPVAYAILGSPYAARKQLNLHRAKYTTELRWICPVEPTWMDPTRYVPVKASLLFECDDAGNVRLKAAAPDIIRELDPMTGHYIGNIGDRVVLNVHVTKVVEYRTSYKTSNGVMPFSTYRYFLKTLEGNTVTWHTSCDSLKEGGEYTLSGVVHEQYEYYNVRCTGITSCKILKEGKHHDLA